MRALLAGLLSFHQGQLRQHGGRSPPIERPTHALSSYDLVVIGGPIWVSHPAPPVRAYLRQEAGRFSNVAFFLMQALAGVTPNATLVVRESDVKAGRFSSAVSSFAAPLRKGIAG